MTQGAQAGIPETREVPWWQVGWERTGLQPCPLPLQVTFCDPVIERRPRLRRQKRIFSKRRGVDGERAVQP